MVLNHSFTVFITAFRIYSVLRGARQRNRMGSITALRRVVNHGDKRMGFIPIYDI